MNFQENNCLFLISIKWYYFISWCINRNGNLSKIEGTIKSYWNKLNLPLKKNCFVNDIKFMSYLIFKIHLNFSDNFYKKIITKIHWETDVEERDWNAFHFGTHLCSVHCAQFISTSLCPHDQIIRQGDVYCRPWCMTRRIFIKTIKNLPASKKEKKKNVLK